MSASNAELTLGMAGPAQPQRRLRLRLREVQRRRLLRWTVVRNRRVAPPCRWTWR